MPSYSEFFLNTPSRIIELETLEISHPSFSKVYYIVRNARLGISAKLESGSTVVFDYYPLIIGRAGSNGTLDQSFKITLGDLGELIPAEIDRCLDADTMGIKPSLVYRSYRSDDLENILVGPLHLQISEMPMTREGVSFEAKPPTLNMNTTGEIYTLERFPGLRGFL